MDAIVADVVSEAVVGQGVTIDGLEIKDGTIPSLAETDGASMVGFVQAGTGAIGRTLQDKGRDVVSAADFGVVAGSMASQHAALQLALDAAASVGGKLICPANANIKLDAGISIDVSRVTLDCQGATLDFSGMPSGDAISFFTSEDDANLQNPLIHARVAVSNAYLNGPGAANTSVSCFKIQDSLGGTEAISGMSVEHVSVVNFARDVEISHGTFCVTFKHCNFTHLGQPVATTYSIDMPQGIRDAGERINFERCMWNNRPRILNHGNGGGTCFFINCSLDYFQTGGAFNVTDGAVYVTACHIESNADVDWFVVNGENAGLWVDGCDIILSGAMTRHMFFSSALSTTFGVSLTNCRIAGSHSPQNEIIGGTGAAVAHNLHTYTAYGQPLIGQRLNQIANSSFEQASITEWSINGSVSRTAAQARSGSNSLQITGAAGVYTYALTKAPCSPQQSPSGRIYYKTSGLAASGGTFRVQLAYLDRSGNVLFLMQFLADATDKADWTVVNIRPQIRSMQGVREVQLAMALDGVVSGAPAVYVDDVLLNVI